MTLMAGLSAISLIRTSQMPFESGARSSCALPISPSLKYMIATVGLDCAKTLEALRATPAATAKYRDSFIGLLLGGLNGQREPFGGPDDLQRAATFVHHRPALLGAPVQLVVGPPR